MMMSLGVTSGRIVPSRRPRARTCSIVAGRDRLFEEPREGRGDRLVALRGGTRVFEEEVEGAERQRGEEGRARRVMAVDGSDPDTGLLGYRRHRDFRAVAPDSDRGGGEDA
jgi:hypothetical protein